ncbi:MAG: sigma-70 family RNA polymerase sigma factor [Actinomycetota bacterium]|nr:sigma-70 family RNA polymerase sigma factor [Actinomycetota bacterium]
MASTTEVRQLNDAELIAGARKGDSEAYGELYRRHVDSARAAARALTRSHSDADDVTSEAFARVLRALQGGGGPEVSFRPYLVTAVRNVFYDRVRRDREQPSEDLNDEVNVALLDSANSKEDGALAAAAFATLPERWQLVLWHTEVEGRSVSEVAPLLGLAPNAVAALAYRAREGLRQAYLQVHLRDQHTAECRECSSNLGAYVRDGLSARDRRRIDAHLETCASCRALVAELADTNATLRAALIPALLGVPAAMYLSGLGGKGVLAWLLRLPKKQLVATGAASAAGAVLAAAVVVSAITGGGSTATPPPVVPVTAPAGNGNGNGNAGGPTDGTGDPADSGPTDTAPTVTVPTATTVTPDTSTPTSTGTTVAVTPPVTSPRRPPVTVPTPTTRPATPTTRPATTQPATTQPATTQPATTTTQPATTTTQPQPAQLTVVAAQLGTAVAGGEFSIEFAVSNTGGSAVPAVQLLVPAPPGTTFVRAERVGAGQARRGAAELAATDWTCTGNVSCTSNALPPGQTSSMVLTFQLSLAAPSSITITPTVVLPADAVVQIKPVVVVVGVVDDLLVALTAHGAIRAIGNSVTTCAERSTGCIEARNGAGSRLDHNDHPLQYVNTAGGEFNSSSAELVLAGTPWRAFLVWGGETQQGNSSAPNGAGRATVSFTTPSAAVDVVAQRLADLGDDEYFAYADVTSLVTEGGTYSVADVQTSLGAGSFGGWSLIVVDLHPSLPERFLLVAAPMAVLSVADSVAFSVDLQAPMSNATATLSAVAFEGDRSLDSESVSLSGSTIVNPFGGWVPGPRDPSYENSLGTDVLVAQLSRLQSSRLSFTASSDDDRVMLAVVAIALDVGQPGSSPPIKRA